MRRLFYPLIVIVVLYSSCSKTTSPNKENELHLNFTQEPSTLDPRKNVDFISTTTHFLIYEGLFTLRPEGIVPGMAESYVISDDKRIYTFRIKDSKWSNGDPVTAYDFEQTWKDMLDYNFPCPNAHLLYPIKNAKKVKRNLLPIDALGIKALDDKTLQVELEQPTPYFFDLISFCVFSPINQKIAKKNPNWFEKVGPDLTSNGSHYLDSWKRNGEMVFKKNPYYWDAKNISTDSIVISIVNNESTALQMFENKELDLLGLPFTSIPYDAIENLQKKNQIEVMPACASTVSFFNVDKFPFHNKNIRKAFALAINRKSITENITQQKEKIGTDFVPPALKGNQSYLLVNDNDIEAAKIYFQKGLEELGIQKEEIGTLVYMHPTSDESAKIAQVLQEQWRKVLGVKVELKGHEYKIFMDKLVSRDYQFSQARWVAQYPDQMNILERFMHVDNPKNYSGWYDRSYNRLLKDSIEHFNKEERYKILKEAEEILAEEMPFTVLYHWNSIYLKQPNVKNLSLFPNGGFYLHNIKKD